MRPYVAMYKGKTIHVVAPSSYAAQQEAAAIFKAKKAHDVTVYLADVVHNPSVL